MSGEQRLSNFLLWQTAYSEYVFTPTLWPDFGEVPLRAALSERDYVHEAIERADLARVWPDLRHCEHDKNRSDSAAHDGNDGTESRRS